MIRSRGPVEGLRRAARLNRIRLWRWLRRNRVGNRGLAAGDAFRVCVANIAESRVFFAANVVAIAVGILLIVVLSSMIQGLRGYIDTLMRHEAAAEMIEVTRDAHTPGAAALTAERIHDLATINSVVRTAPLIQGIFGELAGPKGVMTPISLNSTDRAIDPELTRQEVIAGSLRDLTESQVIVPISVATDLGLFPIKSAAGRKVFLRIARVHEGREETLELPVFVAAVLGETRYSRCYASLPLMRRLVRWQSDPAIPFPATSPAETSFVYDSALLWAATVDDAPAIRKTIEQRGYKTASILDSVRRYREIMLITSIILSTLGLISVFTGSISIFNSSYAAVMRRMHEFAIFKTYGATRGAILAIVLGEAFMTALFAGFLGFLAGWGACAGLQRSVAGEIDAVLFPVGWQLFALAEAIAILACVMASYVPARRAAGLSPMEVMRLG